MGVCLSQVSAIVRNEPSKGNPTKALCKTKRDNSVDFDTETNENHRESYHRLTKKRKAKIDTIGDDQVIYENIKINPKNLTQNDYTLIMNALQNNNVFQQLNQVGLQDIVAKMFYCTTQSGLFVFQQGNQASSFFIIEQGTADVIRNNEVRKALKRGDFFGELALLYGAPRSASVKCTSDCGFWAIDRVTFKKAIEEIVAKDFQENREFLAKVQFFQSMTEEQKDNIASVLITQVYKKGQQIVHEGDQADSYFIIKSGTVQVSKGNQTLKNMNNGDSFGEQALFKDSIRGATVIALDEQVICLALGRDKLTEILGDNLQSIIFNNLVKWALQKHNVLHQLTSIQIEKMVANLTQVKYNANDVVFKKGNQCDKMVIVLESAIKKETEQVDYIHKGEIYGEYFLINNNFTIPDTLVMTGDGILAEITYQTFESCIGGNLNEVFIKNLNSHEKKYMGKQSERSFKGEQEVRLEDFICIKKLGQGQFGNVYLVKHKRTGQMYGLKSLSKAQIVQQGVEKNLILEKKVMQAVNFPLIMQFTKSFQTQDNIFFLIEYIKGIELFDVIRQMGILNSKDCQFYVGSLIVCMEYLHSHLIIYRDLKPENVMVDYQGYVRLIDLGTCKFLATSSSKTFTMIGTPHYMAPEAITGMGYTFNADLWSVGICFYEFMCGKVPYGDDIEDPFEIYKIIIQKPLVYPNSMKDVKAKKMIDQLLNKTPAVRMGGSYAALKANNFFDKFDWDKLLDKMMKGPFVPSSDKMISEEDIQKGEKERREVVSVIVEDCGDKYVKEKAKDINWDHDF